VGRFGWAHRAAIGCVVAGMLAGQAAVASAEPYPLRWFYLASNFAVAQNADRAIALIEEASRAGLNGVVLADAKFATLGKYNHDSPSNPYYRNIRRVLDVCRRNGVEVVVYLPTISKAHGILAHDPNLAAGYEVRDAVFEVRSGTARLVQDPAVRVANGGFEDAVNQRFRGWDRQDDPGSAVVADRGTARMGVMSARLQFGDARRLGHARLGQRLKVAPRRCYRVSLWLQTGGLAPTESFNILIRGARGGQVRVLAYNRFSVKATQSWTQMETVFNSLDYEEIDVYLGLFGVRSGRAWVDDVELTEVGLVNVLRRPGCPLTVRSWDGRATYVEGQDFEPVYDPLLGKAGDRAGIFDRFHPAPDIRFRKGVPDGTRLRVGFYHPLIIHANQIDCCMSEQKVFDILEDTIRRLNRLLDSPKYWWLGYDELRTGGGCRLCKASGKTPGQLLAEHVRRVSEMVRKERQGAEIVVWYDMFYPGSNAKDEYYLVEGSLTGSWEGPDPSVMVSKWSVLGRDECMRFFADRGHRQILSADFDSVKDPAGFLQSWLESMDAVSGVQGIMYTTWTGRYDYLSAFGRTLKSHSIPASASRPVPN